MDILKKALAPISEEAWELMNGVAKSILLSQLSARKFVTVDGPKGWDFGAVPLGRLDLADDQDVKYGIRQILPLIETSAKPN